MDSLRDRLQTWFSLPFYGDDPVHRAPARAPPAGAPARPDYVLRGWPALPDDMRQARVYRLLSVMSVGPCGRGWLRARTTLSDSELDRLLKRLVDEQLVELRERGPPAERP